MEIELIDLLKIESALVHFSNLFQGVELAENEIHDLVADALNIVGDLIKDNFTQEELEELEGVELW